MNVSDLDLVALSQALDDHEPDREHYLDRRDGSLWTFVFSESTDETRARREAIRAGEEGWIEVPSMTTQQAYEEIEDFVDSLPDEGAREALFAGLEAKGSLRNFREALVGMPEVRQLWTSFRRERSRGRLDAFLDGQGLSRPEPAPEGAR